VFAFFAAGVSIGGLSGFTEALSDPVALGIVAGLVVGKTIGVFGTTYVMSKVSHANLDPDLSWLDVLGVAVLAGIGFTVSLLIGELAFAGDHETIERVKVAVLTGSILASVLAAVLLRARNRAYARIHEEESQDADADGIPDVYQGR
jgi:NhaA family Na+:H+ antiporter